MECWGGGDIKQSEGAMVGLRRRQWRVVVEEKSEMGSRVWGWEGGSGGRVVVEENNGMREKVGVCIVAE